MNASAQGQGVLFRIKKGDSIGEPDAESDETFLNQCFVDTGDYETLVDCSKPQCVVLGRTGSGKSALLMTVLQREERVIEISPENLSLQFIANSDIIKTLEAVGVKLDIFYTLLWKHVLTVELLKFHFKLTTEEKTNTWVANLLGRLKAKDQAKERAISYIREWGDKFWHETEYRIKEITQRLEQDIKAELGADIESLKMAASTSTKAGEEKVIEVVHRAQRVINNVQIKALSDVLRFLGDDVFTDPQTRTYILIDKLDEDWAADTVRYRLIRSLIETLKSFRSVRHVKILVAMRRDLLETVFEKTRDSGFQEEKYESLFLKVKWSKSQLRELLDKRVRSLVKGRYTSGSLGLADVFPPRIGALDFIDHLATRTLYRPRDAIAFVNECLARSEGKQVISAATVNQAEVEYSSKRVKALSFEWVSHYPRLVDYFSLIERMPSTFKISAITKERVEKYAIDHMDDQSPDPLDQASAAFLNGGSVHAFLIVLVKALYHIGIIGVKTDGFSGVVWAYEEITVPTDGQIKPSSTIHLHPMVWSRLGTIVTKQ
jgi:hypothetical protein